MVLEQKPSIIVVSVKAAIHVRQAAQQTLCEIRYNLATEKRTSIGFATAKTKYTILSTYLISHCCNSQVSFHRK